MRNTATIGRRAALLAIAVTLIAAAACSGGSSSASPSGAADGAGDGELVGLFRFTPGIIDGTKVEGTWFRMLQPGGNAQTGPYMINADSPADGGQATLLSPGDSGGLRTGGYQSQPMPAFADNGNSLAAAITQPTKFFGVEFSISTNPIDLQTKRNVPPPTVVLKDGRLTADLSSWAASWNHQDFNQGAPKPVSATAAQAPGQEQAEAAWDWVAGKWLEAAPEASVNGQGATGTYDATTHAFTLDWTSYIDGGPFNGFTGIWHLEGTFEPSAKAPADAPPTTG